MELGDRCGERWVFRSRAVAGCGEPWVLRSGSVADGARFHPVVDSNRNSTQKGDLVEHVELGLVEHVELDELGLVEHVELGLVEHVELDAH